MSFDVKLNIWKLPSAPPRPAAARCKPCDTWSFESLCAESNTHTLMYVSAQAMTSIDECAEIEIDTLACPGMHTGIPRHITAASNAEQKEFLAFVYQQEAMQLHCAYGHCGADILIQSLSHHHSDKYRHLYPYIRRLECDACLLMHGHREYCTEKTISTKWKMPIDVRQEDLPTMVADGAVKC